MDILQSAEIAEQHLENISFENFERDIKTQDAVIRRLEIIGEASSKISDETQKPSETFPGKK